MKRPYLIFFCLILILLAGIGRGRCQDLETLRVVIGSGRTLSLDSWLEEHGPAVLLVWASWAPRSQEALAGLDSLRTACKARDLPLLIVDVQEPFEEAQASLAATGLPWVHDRHGTLLKARKIIRIPVLVVVDAQGQVVTRLEVSAESIRTWSPD